jgi:hypothetical protein
LQPLRMTYLETYLQYVYHVRLVKTFEFVLLRFLNKPS